MEGNVQGKEKWFLTEQLQCQKSIGVLLCQNGQIAGSFAKMVRFLCKKVGLLCKYGQIGMQIWSDCYATTLVTFLCRNDHIAVQNSQVAVQIITLLCKNDHIAV